MAKTTVVFTVKATFSAENAKAAKQMTKDLKNTLSAVKVNAVDGTFIPVDTKVVVKQVKA